MAAITSSAAAELAVRTCSWFLGYEPEAHLLVVMHGRGQHECLLQALSTSIIPPPPPTYAQKGQNDSFADLS